MTGAGERTNTGTAEIPGVAVTAQLIRERRLSPLALMEACLHNIERTEPRLRAFDRVDAHSARQAAREAERQVMRGARLGPLHGVPVACKSLLETGAEGRAPAQAVAALRSAGAVIVGTTRAPALFTFACETRNPLDPARTPGWSSAGSAAAVAAGLVPAALGSDTVGSVRIPAALCGVTALRPSAGLVGRGGLTVMSETFDEVGPMAGNVEDLRLLLSVLAARAPRPRCGSPGPDLQGLRIAVPGGAFHDGCVPQAVQAVQAAADTLCALGARPRHITIGAEYFDRELTAARTLWETACRFSDAPPAEPGIAAAVRDGRQITAERAAHLSRRIGHLRRRWRALLRQAGVDVLLVPTVPAPAAQRDATHLTRADGTREPLAVAYPRLCRPASVTGAPALTVPAAASVGQGLPLGVQFLGAPGSDWTVLRAGAAYEAASTPAPRQPHNEEAR
ncbi:hypothetical protein ADL21_03035 [Streptomyces albus subsp. albus]|nr:hypothetical protein ADL21_03035 [Streptomyces albus subsp. albus]